MKKLTITLACFAITLACTAFDAKAQGAQRGPDPTTLRDAQMERDSRHDLEVARHYFKNKKAYRAAFDRCKVIIDTNPEFSRLDEALYIAGLSSLYMSENRGKQKPINKTTEELRNEARELLSRMVKAFPESAFVADAEKNLRALGDDAPTGGQAAKP